LPLIGFGQKAEAYINSGKTEYAQENYSSALQFFDKAIELDNTNAETFKLKGNAEFGLKKFNRAIASYSKAIQINPEEATFYFNRGMAQQALGKHTKAISDYDMAIAKNPDYARAYHQRGEAKEWTGNNSGAKEDFFKARQLELLNEETLKEEGDKPVEVVPAEAEPVEIVEKESPATTVVAKTYSKCIEVDMSAFAPTEEKIKLAGVQLQNARKTFGVGLFLNLLGGALGTGGYFAKNPKVQTGLIVAGGVTALVGSVVMITAVIPIGGAGKILQTIQFPKTIKVNLE
jgi:tetratricopeptide (TPR) repeat protein